MANPFPMLDRKVQIGGQGAEVLQQAGRGAWKARRVLALELCRSGLGDGDRVVAGRGIDVR
jgi:hypothetical protein